MELDLTLSKSAIKGKRGRPPGSKSVEDAADKRLVISINTQQDRLIREYCKEQDIKISALIKSLLKEKKII
ncbi:MAG: hypothetical protein U9Q90_01940 [Campylobacterota bacterium]|nr:hypothetical protein [Campylobacterota bacterium]